MKKNLCALQNKAFSPLDKRNFTYLHIAFVVVTIYIPGLFTSIIVHSLQITTATLDRFLLAIEDGYKRPCNRYHNEFHATDVTHSVHYFLSRVGLMVSRVTHSVHYFLSRSGLMVSRVTHSVHYFLSRSGLMVSRVTHSVHFFLSRSGCRSNI